MPDFQNETLEEFYRALAEFRGTHPLDSKLVKMLDDLQRESAAPDGKGLPEAAQKVLLVYFSLLRDGNTCISLDPEILFSKWKKKWDGLLVQAREHAAEGDSGESPEAESFRAVFENGSRELLELLSGNEGKHLPLEVLEFNGKPWLFAEKYKRASEELQSRFAVAEDPSKPSKSIFKALHRPSDAEIETCNREVESWLSENSRIRLKKAQVEAILCGQESNMIVTGGPGTGKTTVVQFLLWKLLLENPEMRAWNLYFAAPSGKAANRLNEIRNLEDLSQTVKDENPEMSEAFRRIEGKTLHRLLSFNPSKNAFTYDERNPLPEKSIFVIDEASMIDICLFASFLKALPAKDFRLFLLGDKNQLPSVEAGAVLGELLDLRKDAVVELNESNRFPDDSPVGRFAKSIQTEGPDFEDSVRECGGVNPWSESQADFTWPTTADSVRFVELFDRIPGKGSLREMKTRLREILRPWAGAFCKDLIQFSSDVHPKAEDSGTERVSREKLWNLAESARILSAERRGVQGVESINREICALAGGRWLSENRAAKHFPGQILMFTRNQNAFKLFNGDSGVVVKDKDGADYLMLKSGEGFPCYPLSQFPGDALETAFAITVHKSQGSGYGHILLFLPQQEGHPLLSRQILYTGVTRVKMGGKLPGSLTVASSKDTLFAAKTTITERDTGIFL